MQSWASFWADILIRPPTVLFFHNIRNLFYNQWAGRFLLKTYCVLHNFQAALWHGSSLGGNLHDYKWFWLPSLSWIYKNLVRWYAWRTYPFCGRCERRIRYRSLHNTCLSSVRWLVYHPADQHRSIPQYRSCLLLPLGRQTKHFDVRHCLPIWEHRHNDSFDILR